MQYKKIELLRGGTEMQNVFPEYKSEIILGNGKFQIDPMAYNVINSKRIWGVIFFSSETQLGYTKEKYLSFCMGYSLSWWSDTIQNSRICDMEDKKKDGTWYYRNVGQCGVSVEKVIVFGRYNWDEIVCYY